MGNGASAHLQQRQLDVTNKKAGVAGAHSSAHGYTYDMTWVLGCETSSCWPTRKDTWPI